MNRFIEEDWRCLGNAIAVASSPALRQMHTRCQWIYSYMSVRSFHFNLSQPHKGFPVPVPSRQAERLEAPPPLAKTLPAVAVKLVALSAAAVVLPCCRGGTAAAAADLPKVRA